MRIFVIYEILIRLFSLSISASATASFANEQSACVDLRVGRDHFIQHSNIGTADAIRRMEFSEKDGAVLLSSPSTISVLNLENGKLFSEGFSGDQDVLRAEFDWTGQNALAFLKDGTLLQFELASQKRSLSKYDPPSPVSQARFLSSHSWLSYSMDGSDETGRKNSSFPEPVLVNLKDKTSMHLGTDAKVLDIDASGKKAILIRSSQKQGASLFIKDLESSAETKISFDRALSVDFMQSVKFSGNGELIGAIVKMPADNDFKLIVKRLPAGHELTMSLPEDALTVRRVSNDAQSVDVGNERGEVHRYADRSSPVKISASQQERLHDGFSKTKRYQYYGDHHHVYFRDTLSKCIVPAAMENDSCCADKAKSPSPLSQASENALVKLVESQLCNKNFDEQAWEKAAPSSFSGPLSRQLARKYLLRFQKPGGFDPARHLPALIAILKSGLVAENADAVAAVMSNVLLSSNALYEGLSKKFLSRSGLKEKLNIDPRTPLKACRSKAEESRVKEAALSFADLWAVERQFLVKDQPGYDALDSISPILFHLQGQDAEAYRKLAQMLCLKEFRCPGQAYPSQY